ncbi:MAG TPA: hypothetical protein VJQ09_03490 [Candidatus Limnocylindria bacterium]|nr:hypothetical protein [Candidatus Limnocylindria bacterium]
MFGRKTAIGVLTAILGVGLLGGAALAAFAPAPLDTAGVLPSLEGAPATLTTNNADNKADRLKTILDALVKKGVITQAQEDAILAALKDAAADERKKDEALRHVFADLFEQSAKYLGLTPADLKAKLPGTSLAAIANGTPGKSRDGLIAALTTAVDDAIAKALADNKITKEQADKAKAEAPAHVTKFVDHVWPKREPRPVVKLPTVHAFLGDAIKVATDYLGVKPEDLMKALHDGKSLGDVANATAGKSRDGLIAAITNSVDAKIDQALKDGKVTAEQATKLKDGVKDAVTQLVDRKGNVKAVGR